MNVPTRRFGPGRRLLPNGFRAVPVAQSGGAGGEVRYSGETSGHCVDLWWDFLTRPAAVSGGRIHPPRNRGRSGGRRGGAA